MKILNKIWEWLTAEKIAGGMGILLLLYLLICNIAWVESLGETYTTTKTLKDLIPINLILMGIYASGCMLGMIIPTKKNK